MLWTPDTFENNTLEPVLSIVLAPLLTNEFDTQIEQSKKQEKSNRFLNREGLDSSNILIEKRRK